MKATTLPAQNSNFVIGCLFVLFNSPFWSKTSITNPKMSNKKYQKSQSSKKNEKLELKKNKSFFSSSKYENFDFLFLF